MLDDEALSPLRGRYDAQHYRLVRFYYECSNLRYLTSLITIPKLPQDPPNTLAEDENAPALPSRPKNEPVTKPRDTPPPRADTDPEPINEFWKNEQARQQEEYEAEQRRLQAQWEEAQRQQQLAQQQAQRDFEEQQRLQQEQQRMQLEALQRDQYSQQTQGRMAELERENLNARAQYERDQLMLEQYDRRMKALEQELAQLNSNFQQQNQSKDDQIRALQEQVNTWRTKYEALAKLYSQLRHEHLELLQKFKGVQLKASSAQEAIDQREKLQRELKTKNLELADMIRERDRALHDKDRTTGGHRDELEKLKRELRMALDRAENADRAKGSELSAMLSRHNREIADLEEALRNKTRTLDDMHMKLGEGSSDLERQLREKEEELEIYKSGMDQTLLELNDLRNGNGVGDKAMDEQIDVMLLENIKKINELIDSVLQSAVQRVDDALYELDSSMIAGNQNASGPFVLSTIENAQTYAIEFSTSFNNFIADGPSSSEHAEVIKNANKLANAIADVLSNTKGLTRFASDEKKSDQLMNGARNSANKTIAFLRGIMSYRLDGLDDLQKTDVVINKNNDVQLALRQLSKVADAFAPKSNITGQGDIGELVDNEMTKAAQAIDAATERLSKLMNKSRDGYSTYELKIHDAILAAAVAVTNAIAQLIKAATASQQEIVNQGRGSSMTKSQYYKKNNRWTEGLISAAKAVASSTNMLIETADGVITGRNSPEQLIVASNDVAASTAQLVAASRVKASFMSKTQERLEECSKSVTSACRSLVKQVQAIIESNNSGEDLEDYSKLSGHDFKKRHMEQQVSEIVPILLSREWSLTMTPRSKFSSWRMNSRVRDIDSARCGSWHIRKTRSRLTNACKMWLTTSHLHKVIV